MLAQQTADPAEWRRRKGIQSCESHTPAYDRRLSTIHVPMESYATNSTRSLAGHSPLSPLQHDLPYSVDEDPFASLLSVRRHGRFKE